MPNSHMKIKKALNPFYRKKYFVWKMNAIHPECLSKIFFMVKWTFLFSCHEISFRFSIAIKRGEI